MVQKETKHKHESVAHPTDTAGVDTTEKGPSRLHAPGKPHEVESGPSRMQTSAFGRHPASGADTAASTRPSMGAGVDTTEAGPARVARYTRPS
jgi:hypothetical protein